MKRIVAIAGFESFNANLYRQAAQMVMKRCEGLEVTFFSDCFFLNSSESILTQQKLVCPNLFSAAF